jgi:two-component system chemotaxis response regulator CheB
MIKVLVAEDSAVQRELLVYFLGQDADLTVVGAARNGTEAVDLNRERRPDVIVMDVHMPGMNGYEATRRILEEAPTPIVMVSASIGENEVELSFEALQAGALAMVAKPLGPEHPDHQESVDRLTTTIKLMSEVKVVRRWRKEPVGDVATLARKRRIEVVAIGASTGGPGAIVDILQGLPPDLDAAVVIVQHMLPGFVQGFAKWLGPKTGLDVQLANDGDRLTPGRIFIAPDGRQTGVSREGRISLQANSGKDGFCPSASFLFSSVARAYGSASMGVVLTGMGQDGADGLLEMRRAGGLTIAQEAETCAVFGMPKAAIALGAAEHVLRPEQIAALVRSSATRAP